MYVKRLAKTNIKSVSFDPVGISKSKKIIKARVSNWNIFAKAAFHCSIFHSGAINQIPLSGIRHLRQISVIMGGCCEDDDDAGS
jgi:hypothetical protein